MEGRVAREKGAGDDGAHGSRSTRTETLPSLPASVLLDIVLPAQREVYSMGWVSGTIAKAIPFEGNRCRVFVYR